MDGVTTGIRGSSPLTRGKLFEGDLSVADHRLIPAHAGKTSTRSASSSDPPAHPRSRGENSRVRHDETVEDGSSPLTRGKRAWGRRLSQGRRLIPAHAGKTTHDAVRASRVRAHPRSRGENARGNGGRLAPRGSSPLTRGKPGGDAGDPVGERLIPAHAGKTV